MADRDGVFHAACVNGQKGVFEICHTSFAVDPALLAQVRVQNAAPTSGPSAPVPEGREYVTQELIFETSNPNIDFDAGVLEITMQVVNPTSRTFSGPMEVVLDGLMSWWAKAMGLRGFRVANAGNDDEEEEEGAMWNFEVGPGGVLPAQGTPPPRVLSFSVTGGIPNRPEGYFEPVFRIFARLC